MVEFVTRIVALPVESVPASVPLVLLTIVHVPVPVKKTRATCAEALVATRRQKRISSRLIELLVFYCRGSTVPLNVELLVFAVTRLLPYDSIAAPAPLVTMPSPLL